MKEVELSSATTEPDPLLGKAAAPSTSFLTQTRLAWALALLGWLLFIATAASRVSVPPAHSAVPPPVARARSLSFLVLGGWAACNPSSGSGLLAAVAAATHPAFVVSAGDNFASPAAFASNFPQPGTPWYGVAGDGDWRLNVSSFAALRDARWRGLLSHGASGSTSHYADESDAAAQPGAPLLDLFYVDTTPWFGWARANSTLHAAWSAGGLSGLSEAPMNSVASVDLWQAWEDAQAARLAAALAASGARWKIVIGHQSIYSALVPPAPAAPLARLNGVLRRGGSHAYISGQSGVLELIAAAPSPEPVYAVAGAAGAACRAAAAAPSPAAWNSTLAGLLSVQVNSTHLTLRAHVGSAAAAYTLVVPWSAPPQCTVGAPGLLGSTAVAAASDPRCGLPPAAALANPPPPPPSPPPAMDSYASLSALALPGGADWDFVTFDASSQTLLVGRRADGVAIVDVRDASAMVYRGAVASTNGTNGVTLMPDLGLAVSVNGAVGAMGATVFTLPSAANNFTPRVLGVTTFSADLNAPGNCVYHPAMFKARRASRPISHSQRGLLLGGRRRFVRRAL